MVSKLCLPTKPALSFLTVPRSKLYEPWKWWERASSRFSLRKVWNGMKCNFSSVQHQDWNVIVKLSISRVQMCNFTMIGPKTKKLWLSINPARRPSEQPGLGPPQKCVNCNFPSRQFDNLYGVGKLLISDAKIWSFSMIGQKIKSTAPLICLPENRKFSLNWALWCASRGIDNFSLSQLHRPYVFRKLSISWVEICNFQQHRT